MSHAAIVPDSIALLDEKNGLLFTGDTFYPGPIFLYRPETDLDAYVASVQKLARLAPRLKLLLPAHNVPAAEPAYLAKVISAMQEVRSGKAKPKGPASSRGIVEYMFDGFSFRMSEGAATKTIYRGDAKAQRTETKFLNAEEQRKQRSQRKLS